MSNMYNINNQIGVCDMGVMFNHDVIDFNVEKFHLNTEEGYPISPEIGVGIRRTDNKAPFAIVSEAYEPVQYKSIVENVENSIYRSGLDLTDAAFETNVYADGAKLELRAFFPAHQMEIDKGDIVTPEFRFRSSHNGTWANNGFMGAWRSACWNTLVSGDKLAYVFGKHTKNFSIIGFASKIKAASEYIANDGLKQMRDWYHTDVSRDNVIHLFTQTLAKRTNNITREVEPNKVMLSNLMKIFDEENRHLHSRANYEGYATRNRGTLWSAYQAATYWSSHDKDGGIDSRPSHTVIGGREDKVRKMLHSPQWMQMAA